MSTDTVTGTYADVVEDVEQRERDTLISHYFGAGQQDTINAIDELVKSLMGLRGIIRYPYYVKPDTDENEMMLAGIGDGFLDDWILEFSNVSGLVIHSTT